MKNSLTSRLVDTYLRLTEAEMTIFDEEVETTLSEGERQNMMRTLTTGRSTASSTSSALWVKGGQGAGPLFSPAPQRRTSAERPAVHAVASG